MARTGRARPKRKGSSPPAEGSGTPAAAPPVVARQEGGPRVWRRGVRLGVDVGSVRVGLAACDPDGLVATAVETLRREDPPRPPGARRRPRPPGPDPRAVPTDVARIAAEVRDRGAVEVVVGLPRSLSGQEGRAAGLARSYAAQVAGVVAPVPVRLVDERLSTAGAHRSLHEGGTSGRRHRSVVDQVAAAWILQTAIDLERRSGQPPGPQVEAVSEAVFEAVSEAVSEDVGGTGAQHGGGEHDEGRDGDGRHGQEQREHDEQHDDEVGGRTGALRTGEDAERRAQGPSFEEDASVSTGTTTADVGPRRETRPAPRPGPPPGARHRAGPGTPGSDREGAR